MSAKPRVLLLVDHLADDAAGAERTVLWLGTSLPELGFDVTVATTRNGGGWPLELLEQAGARHIGLQRRSRFDLAPFARLARHMHAHPYDVVHAHMFGSNVWGTLLGRLVSVPAVIAHEHSWPYEGEPLRRALDCVIGHSADAFVAVSKADAALMRSYEHVPADRIRVIPSGWAPRSGPAATDDVRADLGIPADAPVVGTVAHLRPVKRLELLVQAFARVLEEVPDAWLLIGGDGPVRPELEAEARRLGVDGRTRVSGMVADVGPLWDAIDVAAMTSDREGTPTAALEAMAAGVPMVAPAVGGIPDVFEGGGGVLFERHDVGGLATQLMRLLRDPAERERIGAIGRVRAQDYTIAKQVERCADLYRELLAAPRRRPRPRPAPAGLAADRA